LATGASLALRKPLEFSSHQRIPEIFAALLTKPTSKFLSVLFTLISKGAVLPSMISLVTSESRSSEPTLLYV